MTDGGTAAEGAATDSTAAGGPAAERTATDRTAAAGPAAERTATDGTAAERTPGEPPAPDGTSPASSSRLLGVGSRRRRIVLITVIAAVVLAADQITKSLAVEHLSDHRVHLIGPFYLALSYNTGVAFSVGAGLTLPIILIAAAVVGSIVWLARRIAFHARRRRSRPHPRRGHRQLVRPPLPGPPRGGGRFPLLRLLADVQRRRQLHRRRQLPARLLPVEEPRAMTAEAVQVPLTLAGERVDRAVAMLTGQTRAEAGRLVDSGGVTLDGGPVERRSRRLRAGEQLAIDLSSVAPAGVTVLQPAAPGTVDFTVISEAADFVVVDKPAGVVTHPGAGHREATLAAGLLGRYPELARLRWKASGRRIARASSIGSTRRPRGLLVVARSPEGYSSLVGQLAARTRQALLCGARKRASGSHEGLVDGPIGRSDRDPTAMAVVATGRGARTSYRVRRRFTDPVAATELELQLQTGRTHQIRVHLAAIGHPVLGDSRYGGSRRRRAYRG